MFLPDCGLDAGGDGGELVAAERGVAGEIVADIPINPHGVVVAVEENSATLALNGLFWCAADLGVLVEQRLAIPVR